MSTCHTAGDTQDANFYNVMCLKINLFAVLPEVSHIFLGKRKQWHYAVSLARSWKLSVTFKFDLCKKKKKRNHYLIMTDNSDTVPSDTQGVVLITTLADWMFYLWFPLFVWEAKRVNVVITWNYISSKCLFRGLELQSSADHYHLCFFSLYIKLKNKKLYQQW